MMRGESRFPKLSIAVAALATAVAVAATPASAWTGRSHGSAPDIVERLERTGKFTLLLTALETANLKETLATGGPFTLFAPTDDAFAALLAELGISAGDLLANPDLANILLYHVVGGSERAGELLKASTHETLYEGRPVLVVLEGLKVKVNQSNVVRANVKAGNGIIHVLDKVLLPPSEPMMIQSLVDVLRLDGRFTVLLAALERTSLDDAAASSGPFTLFAPTDDAFAALLGQLGVTADQLLDNPSLTDILLYHVAPGRKGALELLVAGGTETLLGQDLKVRPRSGGLYVNDSRVRNANINAPNGVIHTLDAVLLP